MGMLIIDIIRKVQEDMVCEPGRVAFEVSFSG